jgi:hypothetical protein
MIFKFAQTILWVLIYVLGYCDYPILIVTSVDLILAILYVEFFVNYKKLDPTDIVLAYPVRKDG